MTFEKPWSKQFDELLRRLESTWGGKIKRPSGKRAEQDPRFTASDFFFYPTYYGEIESIKFSVGISEMGRGDLPMMAAADNSEFINLRVYQNNAYKIRVTRKSGMAKIKKLFGMSEDVASGDAELDKKYLFKTSTDQDNLLLKNIRFQQSLKKLEPFSHFEISKAQIIWLQGLSANSQLEFQGIRNYTLALIEIAKIAG
jgi:hypothetical protein